MSRPSIDCYRQGGLYSHASIYPDRLPIFSVYSDEFNLTLTTDYGHAIDHADSLSQVIGTLTAYRDAIREHLARTSEPAADATVPTAA